MATRKTQPNDQDVKTFLNQIENEQKKTDALRLLELFKEVTNMDPVMWRSNIIGFGHYHYKYDSGREGDWFLTGFSPRKKNFSLYIMSGFDHFNELITQMGKFSTGKSCLYIQKLDDIDQSVLSELIKKSVAYMKEKYHSTE